jgi:phosphate transport system substrate-binding protein
VPRKLSQGVLIAGLTTALLLAAACGGGGGDAAADRTGAQPAGAAQELSGTIRIDGSSTVAPLSEAAAELFMQEHPGVRVTVGTSGTGGGFEKFCLGETDISNASRPIKDEEAERCEENGIAFEQVTVANDALSLLVHPDNPVDCLTVGQVRQIWAPGSRVGRWGQIEGLPVAFDEELELYGPGTDSGTFDYFTEAVNGEPGAQRTDYNNIGEDDRTGIIGVQGTRGAMFYVGFSYYVENQGTVKALQIDGGQGCVAPSLETVQDGSYTPLARPLFVYISDTALAKPEVLAFAEFYVENDERIAQAAGFVDLTDEQQQEARDKVASVVGGS